MNKYFLTSRLTLAALAIAALFVPAMTNASDHIDGPQLANDHASDIGDVWFFLDPNDNAQVVMVMSINPFLISSEIIGQAIFDHNIRYRFEIENTGDAQTDIFFDVRFTRGVGRETGPQIATVTLPSGQSFTAPTNVPSQGDDVPDIQPPPLTVTTDPASGVSIFAGVADDPFFLDNTAANRFVLSSLRSPGNPNRAIFPNRAGFNAKDGSDPNADNQGPAPRQGSNPGQNQGAGRDTYSGFSTLLILVRAPAAILRGSPTKANLQGNLIGLNGVTQRQRFQIVQTNGQVVPSGAWVTVDREGVPLVNNGLIPAARKDEYNGATPVDDAAGRFRADLITSMNNFGTDAAHQALLLSMFQEKGDILRLDLRVPNTGPGGGNNAKGGLGHMGGRRFQDDAADLTFTMLNNGVPLTDFVDRNDFVLGDLFPFVAPQVMPNPDGINNKDTRIRL